MIARGRMRDLLQVSHGRAQRAARDSLRHRGARREKVIRVRAVVVLLAEVSGPCRKECVDRREALHAHDPPELGRGAILEG
eukprot:596510-Pyramimonas_sp.AAC.1